MESISITACRFDVKISKYKNVYGVMVALSLEAYSRLTDGVENALDEAGKAAMEDDTRYAHEEMLSKPRRRVNG